MRRKGSILLAVSMLCVFLVAGCAASSADSSASTTPSETASEAASTEPAAVSSEPVESPAEEDTSTESAATTQDNATQPATIDDSGLPTPDPMYQTISILGTVTDADYEADMYTVEIDLQGATESPIGSDKITALEAEDCMIMDAQTGAELDEEQIKPLDRVYIFVSPNMTKSIPPQAQCYAILANPPETAMGLASYVHVTDIQQGTDGGVVVLNQNADLYITIPADVQIEMLDDPTNKPAQISDIKLGTNMAVWYDAVLESYPGQTTATRVVIED